MTDQDAGTPAGKPTVKPKQTRNISKKRLYKALSKFLADNNISKDEPISDVLDALKDASFEEYLNS